VEGESQILANLRTLGITLILCSHRPEVWKFADRIYDIRDGKAFEMSLAARGGIECVRIVRSAPN
jgi:ABC-type bacteriocin/lantibiotic exporter with double-glycine peptidase domain